MYTYICVCAYVWQVLAELVQLVPETNKFHEQLLKIFKKKIKRQKKKAANEGDDEEEGSDEEEDDDDEDMSDLDEEEEEEEEDFCPPGCEPALFEQVCCSVLQCVAVYCSVL